MMSAQVPSTPARAQRTCESTAWTVRSSTQPSGPVFTPSLNPTSSPLASAPATIGSQTSVPQTPASSREMPSYPWTMVEDGTRELERVRQARIPRCHDHYLPRRRQAVRASRLRTLLVRRRVPSAWYSACTSPQTGRAPGRSASSPSTATRKERPLSASTRTTGSGNP